MGALEQELDKLKGVIEKSHKKGRKAHEETVGKVASYLVFLKSSNISGEIAQRLSNQFRRPLVSVYAAFPLPMLRFVAALARELYNDKILNAYTEMKNEQKALWESVLNSLLSGVLDYLDDAFNERTKDAIGTTLYPILCPIFTSLSVNGMGVDLRCTGYTLLSDSAASHKSNQKVLRDSAILGPKRLGELLWRTKDFLVLECILNLFARLLPSINGTASGKKERTDFIDSVFLSSTPHKKPGDEIARMLSVIKNSDWDQTLPKLMDVLATFNMSYPQPFQVTRIISCGVSQPSDRFYVDDKGFLANILLDGGEIETLEVRYEFISGIGVMTRHNYVEVTISLTASPTISKKPMSEPSIGKNYAIEVHLMKDDLPRFLDALECRNISEKVSTVKEPKLSLAESPAALELDSSGKLVTSELEERIENLSQIYGTRESSDDHEKTLILQDGSHQTALEDDLTASRIPPDLHLEATSSKTEGPMKKYGPQAHENISFTTISILATHQLTEPMAFDMVSPKVTSPRTVQTTGLLPTPNTPCRDAAQMLRKAVFGGSDDELSNLDDEPKPSRPRKNASRSTIASGNTEGRIFGFDDPDSTPSRAPRKVSHKKSITTTVPDDDIEEVLPPSRIPASVVSRRRSVLRMTPLILSDSSALRSAASSTLKDPLPSKFSKLQSHKVLTAAAGESTKQVLEKLIPGSFGSQDQEDYDVDKQDATTISSPVKSTCLVSPLVSELNTNQQQTDLEDALQSFALEAHTEKVIPRPVKGNLRKRAERMHIDRRAEKRKMEMENIENQDGPAKRLRSSVSKESWDGTPQAQSSTKRQVKKYGSKKPKPSSAQHKAQNSVDYDALPEAIPKMVETAGKKLKVASYPHASQNHNEKDSIYVQFTPSEDVSLRENVKPTHRRGTKNKIQVNQVSPKPVQQEPGKRKPLPRAVKKDEAINKEAATAGRESTTVIPIATSITRKNTKSTLISDPAPAQETPSSAILVNDNPIVDALVSLIEGEDAVDQDTQSAKIVASQLPEPFPVQQDRIPGENSSETTIHEASLGDITMTAVDDHEVDRLSPGMTFAAKLVTDTLGCSYEKRADVDEIPPKREVVVIDLTEELNMKQKHKSGSLIEPKVNHIAQDPSHLPALKRLKVLGSEKIHPETPKTKLQFAFAPELVRPPSSPKPKHIERIQPISRSLNSVLANPPLSARKKVHNGVDKRFNEPTFRYSDPSRVPTTEDFAAVLNAINQAVLNKINRKFEGVKESVRTGRNQILTEAQIDLYKMRDELAEHYNRLIDLEGEYASFSRKLTHGLEDIMIKDEETIVDIKDVIHMHDRTSLVRMMPTKLIPTELPPSMKKHLG